jgi:hypothetical protein
MSEESIWDKIKFDTNKPNVLKILREQAQQLADKTKGLLFAEVSPVDAYDEKTFALGAVYNFYVVAPFLGNLRTMLFSVVEPGGQKEILLIDRINKSTPIKINDIDELVPKIEEVIESGQVSGILTDLFASSIEARK